MEVSQKYLKISYIAESEKWCVLFLHINGRIEIVKGVLEGVYQRFQEIFVLLIQ